jgi:hypothetical protein
MVLASEEGLFAITDTDFIKYTVDPSDDYNLLKDEVRNIYIDSKVSLGGSIFSIYTYDSTGQ